MDASNKAPRVRGWPDGTPEPKRVVVHASTIGCKVNDKKFDNAARLRAALEPGMTFCHDLYGVLYCAPYELPDDASIVGASGGIGVADGGSQFRPFDPEQPYVFSMGRDKFPSSGGIISGVHFRGGSQKCDGVVVNAAIAWRVTGCRFQFYRCGVRVLAIHRQLSGTVEHNRFDRNHTDVYVDGNSGLGSGATSACLRISSNEMTASQIGIDIVAATRQCLVECNTLHTQQLGGIVVRQGRVILTANYVETARNSTSREKVPSLALLTGASVRLIGGQYNGVYAESVFNREMIELLDMNDPTILFAWRNRGKSPFVDALPAAFPQPFPLTNGATAMASKKPAAKPAKPMPKSGKAKPAGKKKC